MTDHAMALQISCYALIDIRAKPQALDIRDIMQRQKLGLLLHQQRR